MSWSLRFSLAAAALLAAAPAQAGKLSRTRSAVRSSSSSSGSGSGGSGGSGSGGTVRRRSGGGLPPILACATPIGAIFCLPYFLLEQREPTRRGLYHREGFFLRHPYRGGAAGRMVIVKDPPSDPDPLIGPRPRRAPPGTQRFAARVALEYAHDLDGVLRPSGRLQLELPLRLGLESAWTHFIEPLPDGGVDRLTIGDTNLTFRYAQSPRAQFWVGLGLRLLTDAAGTNPGFNFTYGFDLFPRRPLVLSASIDLGNLGWAFLLHGRATVGAALGAFELYAGYDAMLVDPVLFHGPVAGLRVWF